MEAYKHENKNLLVADILGGLLIYLSLLPPPPLPIAFANVGRATVKSLRCHCYMEVWKAWMMSRDQVYFLQSSIGLSVSMSVFMTSFVP